MAPSARRSARGRPASRHRRVTPAWRAGGRGDVALSLFNGGGFQRPATPPRRGAAREEAAMPRRDRRDDFVQRFLTRRGFLQVAVGTTGLLLLTACGGATAPAAAALPPSGQAAPAAAPKPTEA